METKACCSAWSGRKIWKIIAVAIVVVAAFILLGKIMKREASGAWPRRDWSENRGRRAVASYPDPSDQYAFPFDADKTGKIAIKVEDMETAANEVRNVAVSQVGEVVFYEINNATSTLKNGIMVVRIPKDKFEDAFAALRAQGKLVVQESATKSQDYPQVCPMAAVTETKPVQADEAAEVKLEGESQGDAASSEIAIAPAPIACQAAKEKEFSYIKVIFVADSRGAAGLRGAGGVEAAAYMQAVGKWMWVILAVKVVVALLMLAFLIYLIMQFLRHITDHKCKFCDLGKGKEPQAKPLSKTNRVVVKRKAVVKARIKK